MRGLVIGLFLPLGVACGGEVAATCSESLADFCATSQCPMHIDPNNVFGSFCVVDASAPDANANLGAVSLATEGQCAGVIQILWNDLVYQYTASGQLEAVFTSISAAKTGSCMAGPASVAAPSCLPGNDGVCP
jgi:hypothetical protein